MPERRALSGCPLSGCPLSGCKVLDLGIITAGASASAMLADLGADVMKVESGSYIDPFRAFDGRTPGTDWWNRSGFFRFTNRNKRGVGIDLKQPDGRALFLRLAARCDIVLENFRRGVLERLGLTFADLVAVNPRIILASITSQGESGPERTASSFGSTLEATSGLAALTGYPDGPPVISGIALNYPDQIVALFAAGMVVAAVMERDRTGQPIQLDISQRELASFLVGEDILAGGLSARQGNADAGVAWQGCVIAADGTWVAVRAADAAALARVAGADDAAMRAWAAARPAAALVAALREAGIAATEVAGAAQVHDGILHGDGKSTAFARADTGEWAKGFPFQFRADPMRIVRPAPKLGEHTEEVLRDILGLDPTEIAALRDAGATSTGPA